eukprot:3775626-Amphidinium_carterae.1
MNGTSASTDLGHQLARVGALPAFVSFVLSNQCRWHSLGSPLGSGSHAGGGLCKSGMPPLGAVGGNVKRKSDLSLGLKL